MGQCPHTCIPLPKYSVPILSPRVKQSRAEQSGSETKLRQLAGKSEAGQTGGTSTYKLRIRLLSQDTKGKESNVNVNATGTV